MSEITCPICSHDAKVLGDGNHAEGIHRVLKCKTCGTYEVAHHFIEAFSKKGVGENGDVEPHLLSAVTRSASDRGFRPLVTMKNYKQLLLNIFAPQNPLDAIDILIEYMAAHQTFMDRWIVLATWDYPILRLKNGPEFDYILKLSVDMEYLECPPKMEREKKYRLTIKGWDRAGQLRLGMRKTTRAFVAMSFSLSMNDVWMNGIRPALSELGYEPYRVDREHHNEKICDRIITSIRGSGLVIADFTEQKAGVYFEAGFALGLGIPVIWSCRESEINNCHFDTRQYNHVLWSTEEDLREKLIDRIQATMPCLYQ